MSAYGYEEHVQHQALRDFLQNRAYGCATLAEGTNAHTIKTTYAVHYEVGGQAYYKAATDNIAMTACAEQAALTTCYYLVTIAGGTVTITKGTDDVAALPACPADCAVLGAMKIVLANAATFTSGTTDLSATDVTATFANFGYYPENGAVSRFTFA